ncbi:branched-chain amino acid ABC transporter permease [Tissierella sp.]|uniref:branched-chain amino acid ABC transporter permease n=1 Tax=Tissierella sp. TaxID=41274 RepID=UPI00285A4669|nr:branched-chain amino acid ABC transporter permease [Tissierella sp.]MDR7857499.1 branched-chain amino acid ABC transporter permease [Tissierella sp.]
MLQYILNGLPIGAIYALVALSYSFIYAASGVLNWAQGDMVMLGAYVGFTVYQVMNLGFTPALLISMVVVAIAGVLVQQLILKPLRKRNSPGVNVIIGTLGASIILRNIALMIWGPDAQLFPSPVSTKPIASGIMSMTPQDILIVVVSIIIMVVFQYLLKHTKEGKASRAVTQDRYAAVLMGINTERSDGVAFATSAALGAAAGILIAPIFFVTFNMGAGIGLKGFVSAVVGGLGSVPGAITGGFFIGIIESVAGGRISSGYRDAITFAILILVLWLRPSGLFLKKKKQKV